MKRNRYTQKILTLLIITSLLIPNISTYATTEKKILFTGINSSYEYGKQNIIIKNIYTVGEELVLDCLFLNDSISHIHSINRLELKIVDRNNKVITDTSCTNIKLDKSIPPKSIYFKTLTVSKGYYTIDGIDFSNINYTYNIFN